MISFDIIVSAAVYAEVLCEILYEGNGRLICYGTMDE